MDGRTAPSAHTLTSQFTNYHTSIMTTRINPDASNQVMFQTLLFLSKEVDALKAKLEVADARNDELVDMCARQDIELETHRDNLEAQQIRIHMLHEQRNRAIAIANRRLEDLDHIVRRSTTARVGAETVIEQLDVMYDVFLAIKETHPNMVGMGNFASAMEEAVLKAEVGRAMLNDQYVDLTGDIEMEDV